MPDLKHVGRLTTNNRKCIVAYKVIPNDSEHCLVVHTDSLDSDQHDTLIKLVESNAGQTANELATAMARTPLPDGRNMLEHFHRTGKLVKTPTKNVTMIPNSRTSINLAELNKIIAEQQGVTVEDLALANSTSERTSPQINEPQPVEQTTIVESTDGVLSDEDLAAQYRSQADSLFKEAKRLREEAEALSPTKKSISKKKVTSDT